MDTIGETTRSDSRRPFGQIAGLLAIIRAVLAIEGA
jgi:hypothetical protein